MGARHSGGAIMSATGVARSDECYRCIAIFSSSVSGRSRK